MTGKGSTLPPVAAIFVFLTAFVSYAWTASPDMGWLDSPEFVAASASLGVPHSPGHPLPVLLGKLSALVPVGDIAFRVNLMSAVAAALAGAVLYTAARRLLGLAAPDLPLRWRHIAGGGIALAFALSGAAWGQAVRAEVYALQALLFAIVAHAGIALAARDGRDSTRLFLLGCLVAGLALATHHLIAFTFLLPALICVLARRPSGRLWSTGVVLALLGLAAFLYLPVRSAQSPVVNWGAPHTAERLAWTVSARAFHKATRVEHVSSPAEDAAQIAATVGEEVTWLMAMLALFGLYVGSRQRRMRVATGFLAGVVAAGVGIRVLVGFDPETPDHQAYLLPALGAVVLLGGAGLAALTSALASLGKDKSRRHWPAPVAACLLLSLIPYQMVRHGDSVQTAHAADRLADWELVRLPPRTLLLISYFQTSFRLMAKTAVEQARPDVAILDRSFLTYPGAAAEARQRYPDLAALIDAPVAAGKPTPVRQLANLARSRPVFVQLHINLEESVDRWLLPQGPYARFVSPPASPAMRSRAEAFDTDDRLRLVRYLSRTMSEITPDKLAQGRAAPGDVMGVRDALLWHDFVRLRFYCHLERRPAAQNVLDNAWRLASGDVTLKNLATTCGLSPP
ncbi:MAG: DUF2723 domain-containing protein [Proteobacteria bacterium]|nr:DUF2723 domain-containing protein [Pseudomonadota bacterium]